MFHHLNLSFFKKSLLTLAPVLVWMIAFFPGLYDIDFAYLMKNVFKGELSPWHSFVYSGLHWLSWSVYRSILPVMFLQIAIFSTAVLVLQRDLIKVSFWFSFLFAAILLLSPLHSTQLFIFSRDAFFASIFPLALVLIFDFYYHSDQPFYRPKIYFFAILIAIIGALRFENMLLTLGFVVLSNVFLKFKYPERLVFNLIAFSLSLFFKFAPPFFLGFPLNDNEYLLTSFVHPLSSVVHHGQVTKEEGEIIDRVISVESLRNDFDPYEIMPFHKSGPKHFSEQEWKELTKTLPAIFLKNWDVVLASRLKMLIANLGFNGSIYLLPNAKIDTNSPISNVFLAIGPSAEENPNWLSQAYFKMYEWSEREFLFKFIFYSAGPFMYLAFLILRSWRQNPMSGWLLLLTWSKFPLLFVFAPGSQIKYFYPIYLGTIFCFFLAKVEGKKNPIREMGNGGLRRN